MVVTTLETTHIRIYILPKIEWQSLCIWMFEKCSGTSSGTGRARAWRTRVRWPARRSRRSGELRAWGGAAVAQSRRIENLVLCQFHWQKCGEHVIIKSMSSKAIHCRPCRSSCTITAWYKLPLLIFNLLQTGLSLQTRLGNKNSHFFSKNRIWHNARSAHERTACCVNIRPRKGVSENIHSLRDTL